VVGWELDDATWRRIGPTGVFEPTAQQRMYEWVYATQRR